MYVLDCLQINYVDFPSGNHPVRNGSFKNIDLKRMLEVERSVKEKPTHAQEDLRAGKWSNTAIALLN